MSCKFHKAIFHAVLAAALYAVSIPFSKLLLVEVPPTMLAAFLYIGAGIGMAVLGAVKKNRGEEPLQRSDIKYTISMVVLDIVALAIMLVGTRLASVKVEEYNLKRTIYFLTMDVNRNIIPFAQIIC